MLSVNSLSKLYGNRELFSGVNFTVGMNDRIALIGRNGTGKTTLFEIIAGRVLPDAGNIALRSGTTVGYLCQDIRATTQSTLLKYVAGSSDVTSALAHKISLLQDDLAEEKDEENIAAMLRELGEIQSLYESRGGYDSEHEAEIILSGLGFAESDFGRTLSEFSGGWQTRIELARLLFLSPDILLLDEPTNHLDMETQRWFESYLKHYHGAVLFTSHDRAFLNNVVRKIIAIEDEGIIFYHGNYNDYVLDRQKDLEIQLATARRQEISISKEMRFIERFRSKATKAVQVQSRIKKLDKIERIKVPRSTRKIHFNFPAPPSSGKTVIELKDITKSYGKHTIYKGLSLTLERGDRAAIVGVNGAGKTTLLRMLAGVMPFEKGQRVLGHNVTTAYFAQHYIESLNPHNTILEELRSIAPDESDQFLRGLLGAFLFSGDSVTKKISVLSGGEKTRIALARMLTKPANFLLLDEPTNHLDIPSREILTDALNDYKGTICLITHDRTLIEEIATKIIEVNNGVVKVYPGNYDDYLQRSEALAEQVGVAQARNNLKQPGGKANRQSKALAGQLRNEHYRAVSQINQRIKAIEQEAASATERLKEIEALIADPAHYENPRNIISVNQEYKALKEKVAALTAEWDHFTAELERAELEYRKRLEDAE